MATSDNYIKQIQTGEVTYDIAVAHGLTFKTGNNTQTWDGVSDVEVIIPTLDQLISDPIRFAGTVGADGIAKKGGTAITPAKGDLVFITADCTFNGQACEAGDMAVYDGENWIIVSGENQVTIKYADPTNVSANKTEVTLSATAKTVLDVEGKELVLKLPADLVKSNLGVAKNADNVITLAGVATADAAYVSLSYAAAESDTVLGQNKSVAVPTALTDGSVTFTGDTSVIKPTDIAAAWTAGTDGAHESAAVNVSITGDVTLTAGTGNDFVTGWTPASDAFVQSALKSASLKVVPFADKAQDETIAVNPYVISNPTFSNDATLFATGFSTVSTGADFIIPGAVSVSSEAAKAASNGVLVDVVLPTLGDDASFTDANYAAADSATGVIATIADPTVSINNGNVIATASVSDHVLSFTTATVTATATQGAVTYKKAQYKKTVVSNTPSVSYGSIQTADGQGYKLNTQAVNATFTPGATGFMGVDTVDVSASDKANAYTGLTATKGAYTAALSNASGSIASGVVITSVTDAKVPVLGTVSATGSFTGSVSTALTTENVTVAELSVSSINLGSYSLVSSASEGDVMVMAANNLALSGTATIAAGTYVTDVYADADLAGAPAKNDTDKVGTLV